MLQTENVVGVRDALPSDMKFVFATWLRDLRHMDNSPLPDNIFFPAYREYINRILADVSATVLIAHPTDAPDEILGYIVGVPNEALLWLYIKPKFREKGLAKLLMHRAQLTTAPSAFATQLSKARLRNFRRSRQLRKRWDQSLSFSTTESESLP